MRVRSEVRGEGQVRGGGSGQRGVSLTSEHQPLHQAVDSHQAKLLAGLLVVRPVRHLTRLAAVVHIQTPGRGREGREGDREVEIGRGREGAGEGERPREKASQIYTKSIVFFGIRRAFYEVRLESANIKGNLLVCR